MKPTSQIAPLPDGVHFVDAALIPHAPLDAVGIVHVLHGREIAGIWVAKDYAQGAELLEGNWVWWERQLEKAPTCLASSEDRTPRHLELL